MRKLIGIILFLAVSAMFFSSCERNCYCKNLEDGSEGIMYGVYSKSECRDTETFYNDLYNKDIYDCTYK